jgi:hypothetical protein
MTTHEKGAFHVSDTLLRAYVWVRTRTTGLIKDESGEGVISAAIVVLIMAFLGAAMWIAFDKIWTDTSSKTAKEINTIGS